MTDANANNSITIDENTPDWYAQTIFRKALSDIPDHFEKIPAFGTLKFTHRDSFDPTVIANWPKEALPSVLAIGIYDYISPDMKQTVYAFVHGSKNNLVGHLLVKPDWSVVRVSRRDLRNVEFGKPFCNLSDGTISKDTMCNRIRAVILHYFLAAGRIREIGNYTGFWRDFTNSCFWIANEGRPPKLQRKVQREVARPALPAALAPDPVPVVSALSVVASKKRAGDEEPEVAPARIKRRDYSHPIRQPSIIMSRSSSPERPAMASRADARLRASEAANDLLKAEIATQARSLELYQARVTANHQLQAQVTSPTAEATRATKESLYSQDPYRVIQVQCEHLRRQHVNALTDGKGLRGQLRQSQLRCTQAEGRSTALEAELERLRQRMKEVRQRLDDPSP